MAGDGSPPIPMDIVRRKNRKGGRPDDRLVFHLFAFVRGGLQVYRERHIIESAGNGNMMKELDHL